MSVDAELARAIQDFRDGGPRTVHNCANKLSQLLREHPERAAALPQPHELDDLIKRRYVARWRGSALAELGDRKGLSALLAACEPALRANVVHDLGNRRPAPDPPWLPLVAEQLDDESPDVVDSALYVFGHHAVPDRVLATVLDAIVGLLADPRKGNKRKISETARGVLDLRSAAAADITPYFAALDRASDPAVVKRAKTVATAWKAREADPVFAAARRLRTGRPAERVEAAESLTRMLSIDVVDIRGSFGAIVEALAHGDAKVRQAAAELAAVACEEQGGIDEATALARPIVEACEDAVPAVRDAARQAVGFLNRHRETRRMPPLG